VLLEEIGADGLSDCTFVRSFAGKNANPASKLGGKYENVKKSSLNYYKASPLEQQKKYGNQDHFEYIFVRPLELHLMARLSVKYTKTAATPSPSRRKAC